MEIIKKTLSEQIYEYLRMDIITGKIPLGTRLVNRELQEKFEVSSTPIRDAINHLYQDGLITEVTKVGAKITELDFKTSHEVNEILSMLNCAAIKMSMAHADKATVVKQLWDIINKQKEYINSDEYFNFDYRFHKTFFDFGKNENCKVLYKKYHALHEMLCHYFHQHEASRANAIEEHTRITKAYEDGNLELAQKEMEHHHILSVCERFK